ncbi:concanavalin A-like lectin/glucanase [Coniochaeta ligniaria NRRL 30616]|uniref:Concanavalin A-like lectin/glucanase n=1 Tax=Coniochaeta ligniaria NRRL 30616 TaxID=1408157 RepID=A0A1J7K082_9PEZI|nr:concanavalin A-like lectin/glucanase [Coniochaeta ligniaria NRRL 30616]
MPRLSTSPSLVLLVSAYLRFATGTPSLTDDSQCGCYLTNGTITGYFTEHKFFDFRSLDQYQGVPAPITDIDASANASVTSDYFNSAEWNSSWSLQAWNTSGGARGDATVLRVNSPNNVYIEKNTDPSPASKTYLTLRTERLPDFQTAAEVESRSKTYHFLSVRMLARTVGSAGAVTAMFTYSGGQGADVQEADLEVITGDPQGLVHYTNQPSVTSGGDVIPDATQNATLPDGLGWSDWAVHRFDWTPTQSTWYVDGVRTGNISFQVPRDPAQVILNSWSDGGQWTGNMSLHDAAYLQIQWLEMVYNSTGAEPAQRRSLLSGRAEGCKAVCSVDETSKTGTPVMLWTSGAGRACVRGSGMAGWITVGLVLGMAYMSVG